MSLPLLITINVLADIVLLAGLAYVMSRASRLTPHVASVEAQGSQPPAQQPLEERRRGRVAHAGHREPAGRSSRRAGSHAAAAGELS